MGKRSNGEGTIYKRNDGRWCASCYKCVKGREKRIYVYGKTQKEVKEKLKKIQSEVVQISNNMTIAEWIMRWLEECKRDRIKETTYANYKQMIKTHVAEADIGALRLEQLDAKKLQGYIDLKNRQITMYGRAMSSRMVRYIATLLNGALEEAVRRELISENPMKKVILPKKQKKEIEPLSENEVKKLLAEAEDTPLYLPILLEIYTGLRKGELLGLRWTDIDFEQKCLHVRSNLARVPVSAVEGKISELKLLTPKTQKSKRTVPLTDRVMEALKIHKAKQEQVKAELADIWMDRNLVFCKLNGDFLDPRDFLAHFQKALEQAGIRKCRFHDLRHTFASMLLNQGEELKVIQELLGHTTITTTADIYAHLKVEKKFEAVAKIEEALR